MSSLVIIAHNARSQLLAALTRLTREPAWGRVVVVDNGSDDGSSDAVRERFPTAVVVQLGNAVEWGTAEAAGRAFVRGEDCAVVWLNEARRMAPVAEPELALAGV